MYTEICHEDETWAGFLSLITELKQCKTLKAHSKNMKNKRKVAPKRNIKFQHTLGLYQHSTSNAVFFSGQRDYSGVKQC